MLLGFLMQICWCDLCEIKTNHAVFDKLQM